MFFDFLRNCVSLYFLPNYLIFLPDWFYLLMAGIGMGLISIIAPVDCIEKPMDMEDKKENAYSGKIFNLFIVCIVFCFVYIRKKSNYVSN